MYISCLSPSNLTIGYFPLDVSLRYTLTYTTCQNKPNACSSRFVTNAVCYTRLVRLFTIDLLLFSLFCLRSILIRFRKLDESKARFKIVINISIYLCRSKPFLQIKLYVCIYIKIYQMPCGECNKSMLLIKYVSLRNVNDFLLKKFILSFSHSRSNSERKCYGPP